METCAAAALVAIPLSGCSILGEAGPLSRWLGPSASRPDAASAGAHAARARPFRFTATTTERFKSGTFAPTGPGKARVDDKVVTGSFRARLKRRVRLSGARSAAVRIDVSRGTFVGKYDATIASGSGTSQGLIYVDFEDRRTGTACVSFRASYTARAQNATGSFRLLGGTGEAARLNVSGSVTEQFTGQPSGEVQSSMRGRGRAGLGRRRGLPAACRALRAMAP